MNRGERIRLYWEEQIPRARTFLLRDAARYTHGVASLRTLQRRAADGALRVQGGPDRSVRHARILREDLIQFLCDLDSLTGHEPRPKPPPKPEKPRPKQSARHERQHRDQRSLFEEG